MKLIIALYAFSIALLLTTLSGCGEGSYKDGPWHTRPIPVYISPTVIEKCGPLVDEALSFWADLGVDYLEPRFDKPANNGRVYGIKVLYLDPVPGSLTLGQALTYHTDIGGVSTILLYGCHPRTLAHEIGHSLGLPHHKDPNNLMYYLNNGGKNVEITQDQLDDLDSN